MRNSRNYQKPVLKFMQNKKRILNFSEAILESLDLRMRKDRNVIIIGEGVCDPKAIFGSTKNLNKKFKNRVFEMPLSEAAMTGVIIGSSLNGLRPVLIHQRVDFSLLTMDQIINVAAKLHYLSNGKHKVPIVIRAVIGRGWGQSAQHSQSLEILFSHIPGLKVVMPSNAYEAKGLLSSAILDNNPVIFLEHRWLHDTTSIVPKLDYKIKLSGSKVEIKGKDVTIVANSYMMIEAIKAGEILKKIGISCEIINLRVLRPINFELIFISVKKTKRILVIDLGWSEYGVGAEIISQIVEKNTSLKTKPCRIGTKNFPTPASRALIKNYYVDYKIIISEIKKMFKIKSNKINKILNTDIKFYKEYLDVPNKNFKGPF